MFKKNVDKTENRQSDNQSTVNVNQKSYLFFNGNNSYGTTSGFLENYEKITLMGWISLSSQFQNDGFIMGEYKFNISCDASKRVKVTYNNSSLVSSVILEKARWYHIATTLEGNRVKLYINGEYVNQLTVNNVLSQTNDSAFTLGKKPLNDSDYFLGKMDEIRVFNKCLTSSQIQQMVYQEIVNNNGMIKGSVDSKNMGGLVFADLIRYYKMDVIQNNVAQNQTQSNFNTAEGIQLYNINIVENQEAPMPFITQRDGDLTTAINDVQKDIFGKDAETYPWSIIQIKHTITQSANLVNYGLIVDHEKRITMLNHTKLENRGYLKINGVIDLEGKSQLIQTEKSELDPTSSGRIERDQQGQSNKFNYNYWSSPVSSINNSTINHGYTVAGVMKDGTNPNNPVNIAWVNGTNNPTTSNPITLSGYWIYKFQNVTPIYANWATVGQNGALLAGQGYTLKGSGAASPTQNFTFVGKPNNGEITGFVSANNLNLSGNPYPSALDANEFIKQNLSAINGTLYFWEHFTTNNTHNLAGYQGGYATRNLVGGTAPVSPTGVSGLGSSTRTPGRFIPVGQGFFVRGNATGGSFMFNNSQRLFIKENNTDSNVLFRAANQNAVTSEEEVQYGTDNNQEDAYTEDEFMKIRIGFNSYNNYHRQLLIGFMNELATEEIDLGYDAIHIDNQQNDMYFLHNGVKLIIQGASYFDINKVYPLGIKTFAAGNVQFTLDGTENVPEDTDIFIHDKTTGLYHSIKNEHFNIELPQGEIHNRFELTFNNGTLSTGDYNLNNEITVAFTNAQNLLIIKNNLTDVTVETVSIFTILGQTLATWNVENETQNNITLPVSNVSTGTYIVRVQTTAGTISKKIIIK
ncbi:T9SS type A sorting domain-containing protein [Flavobacterium piscinae]|uniref:LamG-like jellyroll fold domain-containing protein n=1 Tax=Flavobacterium piscinae TaxID=2506424 RepID=UPI0019BC8FC7|nr:LamG-like jellyroll fold domain-containing protein [Flavobacterium piscinae]MBC8884518.1 T9SS type A sorting domain-containing protein [Flavobacterium piscinae]